METTDDIRREEGNPRAQRVGGPPRSVFGFFTSTSGARMAAMAFLVVGLLILLIGSILFIAPVMMAGLAISLISGLAYGWARFQHVPK